ncbi:rhomboid family intramembrane serine protease [Pseudorhodoferax sp.]|uniref:rhomboid family intramembrane serine protease n=1 Tax=Pseudorhodoferax sp. TaxID=1993553 RepID=UPI0039E68268
MVPPAEAQADAPGDGPFTPLEFAPTRHTQSRLLAVALAAGGPLAAWWMLAGSLRDAGWPGRVAAVAVLLAALWLAHRLWRQAASRAPVLRLDAYGIGGAALPTPVPWEALEDATLERGSLLCLHRRPAAPGAERRGSRLRLSLQLLSPQQQDAAHDAIHARLDLLRQRSGAGEAASRREAREEAAFESRLDRLVPTPWALYAVVAANVLVWAMTVAAGLSPWRPGTAELFRWGANTASAVVLDGQWWRLLTAAFLHGGLVHLSFNMLGLWEAGKQLCRLLGNGQFLLVYLASALAGGTASLHWAAQNTVSVGASGAVFGVLGALLAASWHYRALVPATNRRRLWAGLSFFIGYSLLHGFMQRNVDNAAHVGGLAGGLLLGLVLLAPIDRRASPARRRRRAAGATALSLLALAYGVLATPLPRGWQSQVYAAQERLPALQRQLDLALHALAQAGARVQRGELPQAAYLAQAQQILAPACSDIEAGLAPLRVPLWERSGRAVQAQLRLCTVAMRSLQLEAALLRRDPALPPDAPAQLQQLSTELKYWLRQRGALPQDAMRPSGGPRAAAPGA